MITLSLKAKTEIAAGAAEAIAETAKTAAEARLYLKKSGIIEKELETIPDSNPSSLTEKEYDDLYNEGEEGYNPYR